jgi:hypothetical protein
MPFSEDEISKIVSENIKKELGIKIDKEPTQTDVTDAKSENLILLDSEANLSQN